jgi:hypothetical protein
MAPERIDPIELRKRMRLALDIITAHRVAKGLSLDPAKVTALRDTLEQRVVLALEETQAERMPQEWSWQKAAEEVSVLVALAIVNEQKNEPPAAPESAPSA